MMNTKWRRGLNFMGYRGLVLAVVCSLLLGCKDKENTEKTTLNVYAAASLTDAFQELESAFEARYPDVDVALNFGGSQTLRFQIEKGAPAHIFASAHEEHVEALKAQGIAAHLQPFAESDVALIVPADNPKRIERLSEIHRAEKIVLAQDTVPIGQYTKELIRKAQQRFGVQFKKDIEERVVSRENSVRKVRAKIAMGEADAAFVYASDVTPNSGVRSIRIPPELRIKARFFSATIGRSDAQETALKWNAFLRSNPGQKILRKHGFSARTVKR